MGRGVASHSILKLIGEDGSGRRRSIRNRVLMVAKLATPSREIDVRLRDVSATGARVEGTDLPQPGETVVLKRGAFESFAQIVWVSGAVAGIAFEEAFDEAELISQLKGVPAVAAPNPEEFRRPGFKHGETHPALSNGRGWVRSARRI